MPFVLIPLLWNKISGFSQKSLSLKERIHGDGILIDANSPEAFEEMLWISFWRNKYLSDRILPWGICDGDENLEFFEFFQCHMKKIILLRQNSEKDYLRYISKNNNNIARLDLLTSHFPDATILIPFRHPLQHAASLLRQHKNFLKLHRRDKFACQYMKSIGHFDFGENLKPIDFCHWIDQTNLIDDTSILFWIKYWTVVYDYIFNEVNDNIRVISYEKLCASPIESLERIGKTLKIYDQSSLSKFASEIRTPTPHTINVEEIPKEDMDKASTVYYKLRNKSII
jgi:hypothetical protein